MRRWSTRWRWARRRRWPPPRRFSSRSNGSGCPSRWIFAPARSSTSSRRSALFLLTDFFTKCYLAFAHIGLFLLLFDLSFRNFTRLCRLLSIPVKLFSLAYSLLILTEFVVLPSLVFTDISLFVLIIIKAIEVFLSQPVFQSFTCCSHFLIGHSLAVHCLIFPLVDRLELNLTLFYLFFYFLPESSSYAFELSNFVTSIITFFNKYAFPKFDYVDIFWLRSSEYIFSLFLICEFTCIHLTQPWQSYTKAKMRWIWSFWTGRLDGGDAQSAAEPGDGERSGVAVDDARLTDAKTQTPQGHGVAIGPGWVARQPAHRPRPGQPRYEPYPLWLLIPGLQKSVRSDSRWVLPHWTALLPRRDEDFMFNFQTMAVHLLRLIDFSSCVLFFRVLLLCF